METDQRTIGRLVAVAVAICAVGATVFGVRVLAGNDDAPGDPVAEQSATVEIPRSPGIEETYGIRIQRVSLIGSNGMVELRYQLLDADKAAVIHDDDQDYSDDFPKIVAGTKTLAIPTFHHHGGDLVTGREFSILYGNAGGAVEVGDTVRIEVGDERLDDVVVD